MQGETAEAGVGSAKHGATSGCRETNILAWRRNVFSSVRVFLSAIREPRFDVTEHGWPSGAVRAKNGIHWYESVIRFPT